MKKSRFIAVAIVITALLGVGKVVLMKAPLTNGLAAGDWSAGRIIDDAIFFKTGTMNPGDIQNFLNAKLPACDTNGGQSSGRAGYPTRADWGRANGAAPPYICLRDFTQVVPSVAADTYCDGIGGGTKSAADIIFNVAQACGVNPQSLIVLLQKEQSLITDDWPWPVQYRSATGFGCPDTAPCDEQYYGFFNQVYNAGRQFKRYIRQTDIFNYAVGRTSEIGYNPQASCGGSNVTVATQASAALYNYTPYQPNTAALANLYGSGDACSAYGNRNFWRMFNDWFGSTRSDSFTVAMSDDGSLSQFILFGGIKQAIPDPEVKIAWGIQDYPVVTMSSSYLATIPSGPYLDRLTRLNTSDQTVFFMDSGKRYRVPNQSMIDSWGLGSRPVTNVPPGLFYVPGDGGLLTYSVKDKTAGTIYTPDGINGAGKTILRPYQSDTVRQAWEGGAPVTEVSSNFFDTINDAIGSTLTTTKISYGGSEYQVVNGARFGQPSPYTSLYPGSAQAITAASFNRLYYAGQVSHLIRSVGENTVYLLDGGVKRAVANPSVLSAWQYPGSYVQLVNNSYVSLIPTGTILSNFTADSSGQLYLLNGSKLAVPTALDGAYRGLAPASVSTALLGLYPTSSTGSTGFIKGSINPQLYFLDTSGKKRHIEWPDKAALLGAYSSGITILPETVASSFSAAASPQTFVSDGTSEYIIEGGSKHLVSAPVKADWGLTGAQLYSDGTLSRFPLGSPLDSKLRDGQNYYLVKGGRAFLTTDINIAGAWGITTGLQMNREVVTSRMGVYMLTRFVKSTTDSRTFIIDGGKWYNLTDGQLANLGGVGAPMMGLEPSNAPTTIVDWTYVVVKSEVNTYYVIDGGGKRSFNHQMIIDQWTNFGAVSVPAVTDGFLNLLYNKGPVERTVKGSAPAVYAVWGATKRHILYPTTYNLYYAPYGPVSEALLNILPNGADL